jgi:hypothetical protein
MVTLSFLASLISLFLEETLDKSPLMMYGVLVLSGHHSAGTNLTAERNNLQQEFTILQLCVRLGVQLE